ncbi:hypothetical protein [Nostoc sp. FACHB-280]|uniref:hypothetical protein n=1 Tax=Nostoc sp. FACHB-280 TaxID=2692839 RepID=UPI00168BAC2B|nr:hypothetical protein [Nostoc sp. FACHB-280]MBD2495259.1 hypothetical protein [Nostoc sp. FACHB-280]
MFHEIERELLDGEFGLINQHYPLAEREGYKSHDIWELPPQISPDAQCFPPPKTKKVGFFSKLKSLSFTWFHEP